MLSFRLYLFFSINSLMFRDFGFVFADKLCVNPACSEPISEARGTVHYIGDKSDRLSFKQGKSIIILSKSKKEGGYWGALIDGNRGYVPSNLIQETKVYYATDKLVSVPSSSGEHSKNTSSEAEEYSQENFKLSEGAHSMHSSSIPSNSDTNTFSIIERSISSNDETKMTLADNLNPTFVVSPYDVIEGTTVYDEVSDHLAPSSTFETAPSSHTVIPQRDQRSLISESQNEKSNTEAAHTQTHSSPNLGTSLPHTTPTLGDSILSHGLFENETDDGNVGGDSSDVGIITAADTTTATFTTTTTTIAAAATNKNDDDDGNDDDYDDDDDDNNDDDDDDDDDDDVDDDSDDVGVDYVKAKYSSESIIVADGDDSDGNNETNHAIPVEYSNEEMKHLIEQKKTNSKDLVHEERHYSQVNEKKMDSAHEDLIPNKELAKSSDFEGNRGVVTAENLAGNRNWSEWETNTKNLFTHEPVQTNIDVTPSKQVLETETTTDENLRGSTKENGNMDTEFTQFSVLWNRPNKVNPSDRDESNEAPQSPVVTAIKEMLSTNILESGVAGDGDGGSSDIHGSGAEWSASKMQEFHSESETQSEPQVGITDQETINKNYLDAETHKIDVIDASDFERIDAGKADKVATDDTPYNNAGAHEPSEPANNGPAHVDNTEENSLVYRVTDIVTKWFATRNEENDGAHVDSKVYGNSLASEDPDPEGRTTVENEGQTSNLFGDNLPDSNKTFIYLVVTAVTVLLFTLGHSLIEKKEKSGPLIAKINKLEQKLFVTSKECLLLKDEIEKAREKISLYENSSNDELIVSLRAELEEAKRAKTELESSVEVLQQELDSATEAGLDLNKMLSEVLTQKGGSESLMESVENLQAQLDSQQKIIDEMTNKLGVKNEENESLQLALDGAHERTEALEEELGEMKSKLSDHLEEKESMARDLKSQIDQLHSRIDQLSASKEKETGKWKKLFEEGQKNLKEKSDAFAVKEKECEALKASLKQVKSKGNPDLSALFDVCRAKAEAAKMEEDRRVAQMELDRERSAKRDLENRVAVAEAELKKLESLCEAAKQREEEAQKKLEVLSTYFKEKETQLQKELGCQEALWAQKKGDEKAVYNMLKSLQEEVESYKSQNETLKQEILDQERGLKSQMAGLEQKAHENWVAARQAERRLEESKQEMALLRNRLTLMEKISSSDGEGKPGHRVEELNGVEAVSPALHDTSSPLLFPPLPLDPGNSNLLPHGFMPHPMFMPPPMSGFMPPPPPPPPPFLPGDRRPPPLGRMSSPPLNSQFSPPPPPVPPHDYAFDRMPSPPPSPHSRSYRSPSEGDREKERSRHKTPLHSAAFPHRTWEESREAPGFIPISSQRDSKREPKGSKVSSGHSSSDSLDHSNTRNSRM